jgi:hypothetical protein
MSKIFYALIIIFLITGASVVSSTENIVEKQTDLQCNKNSEFCSNNIFSEASNAYALIDTYPNYNGVFSFKLDELKNLSQLCEFFSEYGSVAWICSEIFIFADINGDIFKINLETCEYTFIGNTGTGEIVSLAYDPSNETLYGISTNSLYKIDLETGNATLIGSLQIGYLMISCDCDRFGKLYGIDMSFTSRSLYSIDKNTGVATIIGNLGVSVAYSVIAYDKDFDVLYLCYLDNFEYNYKLVPIIGDGYSGTFQLTKDIFDLTISFTNQTQPPNAPTIEGPTKGKTGKNYKYKFSLSDVDNNQIYLRVDWGNGTAGPWEGPYDSGTTVELNHTWYEKGTYTIRAQAKDVYNAESEWGSLEVTIPKYKNVKVFRFLDRFPLLIKLINIMGRYICLRSF